MRSSAQSGRSSRQFHCQRRQIAQMATTISAADETSVSAPRTRTATARASPTGLVHVAHAGTGVSAVPTRPHCQPIS